MNSNEVVFLIIGSIVFLLLLRSQIKDWKRMRGWLTFLNKKAFIISFIFVFLPFFICLILQELDSGNLDIVIIVFLAIASSIFSLVCYIILWNVLDDPMYPDGNATFEIDALLVLRTEKTGKISFPGTLDGYKEAKYRMEQYMVKHGIAKVSLVNVNGFDVVQPEFISPEAGAMYYKNVPGFQQLLAEDEKQKNNLKDDWLL